MKLDDRDRSVVIRGSLFLVFLSESWLVVLAKPGTPQARPRLVHGRRFSIEQRGDRLGRAAIAVRISKFGRARASSPPSLMGLIFHGRSGTRVSPTSEDAEAVRTCTDPFSTRSCTFHAAHVVAGLLILSFTVFPATAWVGTTQSPHQPLHAAALYWHFVDAVWVVVVFILYVLPHFR